MNSPDLSRRTLLGLAAAGVAGLALGACGGDDEADSVQAVPLAFADHKAALERGDIDAYAGTEPIPTQSVTDGIGVRIPGLYDTPAGDFNTAMWAAPKHLGNADLLTAVARMQRDAAELLTPGGTNSETEWRKLLVDQFGFTEAVYKEVLSNVGAVWRFDEGRRRQYEGAADLMLAQGVIKTKPKIDDLLLLDFQPTDRGGPEAPVKDFGGLEITTAVYAKNHGSAPLYWQQFAPPGLKVKPVIVTSPADISRSLAAGSLDFGLMGYYNTIIEAATTGMAAKMICMCSRQGSSLVARKDRGITTAADLKGKKVGVPPPGVQVLMLTAILEKAGLKLGA